jgi:hypothetical protein
MIYFPVGNSWTESMVCEPRTEAGPSWTGRRHASPASSARLIRAVGLTVVRWERRGSQGGPHHGQEMAEQGWSEADGELEGWRRFGAHRRGDTKVERRSQGVEWRRWVNAIPAVPFIGWQREESGQEVKGNGDRWRWGLNPSVSRSRRENDRRGEDRVAAPVHLHRKVARESSQKHVVRRGG